MLDASSRTPSTLPNGIGVGYKAQHYRDIIADPAPVTWLEIHAENYMGDGGRPIAQLKHLAERFAISVHGVGLSIGGEDPLDKDHLSRLKHLVNWLNPASFSEHLAWSTHEGTFFNDLLPLPYTKSRQDKVCAHIDQLQETIGREILLENPSTYLAYAEHEMSEIAFLTEISNRTGCGLLLDVNNVFVASTNQQADPYAYIDAFPLDRIGEIHLGGHDEDQDDQGEPLLIDAHGSEVVDPVWKLFSHTLAKSGPKPVLIEWDNDVPDWPVLASEARRAAALSQMLPA